MHNLHLVLVLFQVFLEIFLKVALYFILKSCVQMGELMSSFENVGVKGFNLIQLQFTELHSNKTILRKIFLEMRIWNLWWIIYPFEIFCLMTVLTEKYDEN